MVLSGLRGWGALSAALFAFAATATSPVACSDDSARPPGAAAGGSGGGGGADGGDASGCPNTCGGACVDLLVDPANCGACGVLCAKALVCRDGQCVPPLCEAHDDCADAFSCTLDTCNDGACTHTIGPNQGPTACPPGKYCVVGHGCVTAKPCESVYDCLDEDPCTAELCDPASAICVYPPLDADGDDHPSKECGGDDCDDGNWNVFPGNTESCDGVDNDCDKKIDEAEGNVDVASSSQHCGACGASCPVACSGGECTTASGIASGGSHACALLADGALRCWGNNWYGQLGTGTTDSVFVPAPVTGLTGVLEAALGAEHSCALLGDGTVRCWGANEYGQVGDGSKKGKLAPTVVPGLNGVVEIAASGSASYGGHSCARLASGLLRCWGENSDGQLGDGTYTAQASPVPVQNVSGAIGVALGHYHSCALLSSGAVTCWGGDWPSGQLGDGTVVDAAQITAGYAHTCALRQGGSAVCWGNNDYGQLGNGTYSESKAPVPVAALTGIVQVTAGRYHTCARLGDGTVMCWGNNDSGQLGDGTYSTKLTPVPVLGGVASVSAANYRTCAAMKDGTVRCWGDGLGGTPTKIAF